jgi:hypothetical protein
MIPNNFSIGRLALTSFSKFPSLRFRDKDKTVHNAGDATKCSRQITYKALKYPESNPADTLGQFRMRFGSWLERGLLYEIFDKLAPFGVFKLATQGDCGEHGTFYGTSWHGYRDLDIALRMLDGKLKCAVIEIKTKVGYGATATLKENAWSKDFIIPQPDQDWGQSQQLALYLRDAYNKTKDNPQFSSPIQDGILLQLLYGDGIACFVEYFFEYLPEEDAVRCYRVHCEEYPQCSAPLDIKISLKEIADRWKKCDEYLERGELAPPDYQRKYSLEDPRIDEVTKTDLTKATQNKKLLGDMQCAYCPYRDKCAEDLGITLEYTPAEIARLKQCLKAR